MTAALDHTHDPALRSWVPGSDGHPDFPIQNLPLGVFSPLAGAPRGGIAIGDYILDLRTLHDAGLLDDEAQAACHVCTGRTFNAFLALGAGPRAALRDAVSALLADGADERPALLHRAADCLLYMPAHVGDYTDFYAGIHHASNVGRLMRPDNPLPPNYKWVPIGYHGRASSLRVSGAEVRRPNGQRKRADEAEPSFGPSRNLDYELELGAWIGQGNAPGMPVAIREAGEHIAGYCLLNDWSARDIQGWEYQPLGPFLAKSFATSISPWLDLNTGSEKELPSQQLTSTYVALSTTGGGAGLGSGDQAALVSARMLGGSAMRAALNSGPMTPVAGVRRVRC